MKNSRQVGWMGFFLVAVACGGRAATSQGQGTDAVELGESSGDTGEGGDNGGGSVADGGAAAGCAAQSPPCDDPTCQVMVASKVNAELLCHDITEIEVGCLERGAELEFFRTPALDGEGNCWIFPGTWVAPGFTATEEPSCKRDWPICEEQTE